jgi:hypothetical protein
VRLFLTCLIILSLNSHKRFFFIIKGKSGNPILHHLSCLPLKNVIPLLNVIVSQLLSSSAPTSSLNSLLSLIYFQYYIMDAHNMKKATATGKRKAEDPAEEAVDVGAPPTPNQQPPYAPQYGVGDDVAAAAATSTKKKAAAAAKPTDSAKVQARLEANRKAARESRRRKKVLVEELQRSVRRLLLLLCWVFLCECFWGLERGYYIDAII